MKTVAVVLLFLCIVASVASAGQLLFCGGVDMFFALRLGVEYGFHPRMAARADLGASIFGTIVADAFYVFYLLPGQGRLRLNLLLGIPTVSAPLTFEAAVVVFGASLLLGYRLSEPFTIELRVGGGFPLFFEPGKDMIRPMNFPFLPDYVWPDLVIGFSYALPGRRGD